MKIHPLGDRVLVEPAKEGEVKKGGIIIPDTAKEKPMQGKVIALGTPKQLMDKFQAKNLEEVFIELTGRKIREEI